jgi:hypothetical protein
MIVEYLTQPIGGVIARPLLIAVAPPSSVVTTRMLLYDSGMMGV